MKTTNELEELLSHEMDPEHSGIHTPPASLVHTARGIVATRKPKTGFFGVRLRHWFAPVQFSVYRFALPSLVFTGMLLYLSKEQTSDKGVLNVSHNSSITYSSVVSSTILTSIETFVTR